MERDRRKSTVAAGYDAITHGHARRGARAVDPVRDPLRRSRWVLARVAAAS